MGKVLFMFNLRIISDTYWTGRQRVLCAEQAGDQRQYKIIRIPKSIALEMKTIYSRGPPMIANISTSADQTIRYSRDRHFDLYPGNLFWLFHRVLFSLECNKLIKHVINIFVTRYCGCGFRHLYFTMVHFLCSADPLYSFKFLHSSASCSWWWWWTSWWFIRPWVGWNKTIP